MTNKNIEKAVTSTDSEEELTGSKRIIINMAKAIGAKAEYHTELKVITKDPKKMFGYLCSQAGYDNDKLNELLHGIRYIHRLPGIQSFFMENFQGYNKLD